jgi:hypothetical protein
MKVVFCFGVMIQVVPKIFVIIICHKKVRQLFAKIELTYKMTLTAKGCDVLADNLRVLVGKSVIIAYTIAPGLFSSPPALYYIFYGKRMLISKFYLPGVDHKTVSGFAVLTT